MNTFPLLVLHSSFSEEAVYLEHKLKLLGKLPTFYISSNGQKVGIYWHFKTIKTPIRLDVSMDTIFLLSSRQIFHTLFDYK